MLLFLTLLRSALLWADAQYESIHKKCDTPDNPVSEKAQLALAALDCPMCSQGTYRVQENFFCLSGVSYKCDDYAKASLYKQCSKGDIALMSLGFAAWVILAIAHKIHVYSISLVGTLLSPGKRSAPRALVLVIDTTYPGMWSSAHVSLLGLKLLLLCVEDLDRVLSMTLTLRMLNILDLLKGNIRARSNTHPMRCLAVLCADCSLCCRRQRCRYR
jgi:hypothetical protein